MTDLIEAAEEDVKPNYYDKTRGTGRTSRMLEAAMAHQAAGNPVIILGHKIKITKRLIELGGSPGSFVIMGMTRAMFIKLRDSGTASLVPDFDRKDTFIDHYEVERRLSYLLGIIHKYDEGCC